MPFAYNTGYCNRYVAEGQQRETRKRQTQDAGFGQYGFVNKVTQIGAEIPWGQERKLEDWKYSAKPSPFQMAFLINLSDTFERL